MSWMRTPIHVLGSLMQAIPGLEANHNMQLANAVSVGTGSLRKQDAERVIREWKVDQRRLYGSRPAERPDHDQLKLRLMAAGIRVEGN